MQESWSADRRALRLVSALLKCWLRCVVFVPWHSCCITAPAEDGLQGWVVSAVTVSHLCLYWQVGFGIRYNFASPLVHVLHWKILLSICSKCADWASCFKLFQSASTVLQSSPCCTVRKRFKLPQYISVHQSLQMVQPRKCYYNANLSSVTFLLSSEEHIYGLSVDIVLVKLNNCW